VTQTNVLNTEAIFKNDLKCFREHSKSKRTSFYPASGTLFSKLAFPLHSQTLHHSHDRTVFYRKCSFGYNRI